MLTHNPQNPTLDDVIADHSLTKAIEQQLQKEGPINGTHEPIFKGRTLELGNPDNLKIDANSNPMRIEATTNGVTKTFTIRSDETVRLKFGGNDCIAVIHHGNLKLL